MPPLSLVHVQQKALLTRQCATARRVPRDGGVGRGRKSFAWWWIAVQAAARIRDQAVAALLVQDKIQQQRAHNGQDQRCHQIAGRGEKNDEEHDAPRPSMLKETIRKRE